MADKVQVRLTGALSALLRQEDCTRPRIKTQPNQELPDSPQPRCS